MDHTQTILHNTIAIVKLFITVVLAICLAKAIPVQIHKVISGSMLPIIDYPAEVVMVSRFSPIQRGGIYVFRAPLEPDRLFFKRIIGIPGDKVSLYQGILKVNNKVCSKRVGPQAEEAYHRLYKEGTMIFLENVNNQQYLAVYDPLDVRQGWEVKVPEGYYLAVGDNRSNSSDSRTWGLVPSKAILPYRFLSENLHPYFQAKYKNGQFFFKKSVWRATILGRIIQQIISQPVVINEPVK